MNGQMNAYVASPDAQAICEVVKFLLSIPVLARQRLHAAVYIAISGLNGCRRNNDQIGTDVFLGIIKRIADTAVDQFDSKSLV